MLKNKIFFPLKLKCFNRVLILSFKLTTFSRNLIFSLTIEIHGVTFYTEIKKKKIREEN